MNSVIALQEHGQSVWLDFLARGFIAKGELKKLIDEVGLRGVTPNPSIFEKAIDSSNEYDDEIRQARGDFDLLAQRGRRALRVHLKGNPDSGLSTLGAAVERALA